ncbi:MAG: hypothetical protein K2Y21_11685 [Phycisphaerales bacterium]|nr:hypothetical protein [Phycisphaerales bacterium]
MSVLTRTDKSNLQRETDPGVYHLVWNVSARALAAVRPELVGSRLDREDALLEVEVRITGTRFEATARITHDGSRRTLELEGGTAIHCSHAGVAMTHLDSGDLIATLRQRGGEHETLYARLPLLSRWGLAGGRYELRP